MSKPSQPPWNKDRSVGPRTEFTPEQVRQLIALLEADEKYRELALLMVAIDSMLRVSDLLSLRVGDVLDVFGHAKTQIPTRQQKNSRPVFPTLTKTAIAYLQQWIVSSNKQSSDFIFTSFRRGWTDEPLSDSAYRRMIKHWAVMLGLDPATYSTHSLRRSKPIYLYQQGVSIELISLLLGHKDIRSTMYYLGIDQRQAQEAALKHDFFHPKALKKATSIEYRPSEPELAKLATLVAEKIMEYKHD